MARGLTVSTDITSFTARNAGKGRFAESADARFSGIDRAQGIKTIRRQLQQVAPVVDRRQHFRSP